MNVLLDRNLQVAGVTASVLGIGAKLLKFTNPNVALASTIGSIASYIIFKNLPEKDFKPFHLVVEQLWSPENIPNRILFAHKYSKRRI